MSAFILTTQPIDAGRRRNQRTEKEQEQQEVEQEPFILFIPVPKTLQGQEAMAATGEG